MSNFSILIKEKSSALLRFSEIFPLFVRPIKQENFIRRCLQFSFYYSGLYTCARVRWLVKIFLLLPLFFFALKLQNEIGVVFLFHSFCYSSPSFDGEFFFCFCCGKRYIWDLCCAQADDFTLSSEKICLSISLNLPPGDGWSGIDFWCAVRFKSLTILTKSGAAGETSCPASPRWKFLKTQAGNFHKLCPSRLRMKFLYFICKNFTFND